MEPLKDIEINPIQKKKARTSTPTDENEIGKCSREDQLIKLHNKINVRTVLNYKGYIVISNSGENSVYFMNKDKEIKFGIRFSN